MGRWADTHSSSGSAPKGGSDGWKARHGVKTAAPSAADKQAAAQKMADDTFSAGDIFTKIGEGLGNAVAGVPRAGLAIGAEALKLPRLVLTAGDNVLLRRSKGQMNSNWLERNLTLPDIVDDTGDRSLGGAVDRAKVSFPVTTAIAQGAQQTASHANPSGGFKSLREDYAADPVGSFLNDAANVATVATAGGAGAGKLALAGDAAQGTRLASAAEKLSAVGRGAGKLATLPFKPYEIAAKLPAAIGNKGLSGALGRIEGESNPTNLQGATVKLSEPAQAVEGEILRGKSIEEMTKDTNAARGLKVAKILSKDERVAATTVAEHTADALSVVRQHDPVGFDAYVTDRYQGSLTPAQANLAVDVVEGKNFPLRAKIDKALATGAEGKGGRIERQAAFAAEHPDAQGYAPSPFAVDKAVSEASQGLGKAQRTAEQARTKADVANQAFKDARTAKEPPRRIGNLEMKARVTENVARSAERRVAKIDTATERARINAEYAIESAPSRLRPVLAENRAAASHLVGVVNDLRKQGLPERAAQVEAALSEVPRTLPDLEALGIDAEHVFHTTTNREAKAGRINRNAGLPRTFKAGSERLRTGSPVYERDLARGQMAGETEAAVAQIRRDTATRIEGIPGAVVHIGEGPLQGAATAAEAAKLGYVPWKPGALFDTLGRVTADETTMFMPKPIFDAYRNYFEAAKGQKLGVITDIPNRAYYLGRLAFSPGYITGQVFGNAMLGAAGSSSPLLFAKNLVKVIGEVRRNGGITQAVKTGQGFPNAVGPRLLRSGAPAAEMARLGADVEGKTGVVAKVSRGLNKAANVQFHLAAFLDNTSRAAFYLTELEKKGSPEAALKATLRTMGEFDKMSPFERDYVRRVIPMWAWHREITKISFHLAVDHPLRVAWTLHLGDIAGKPDSPLPSFYMDTVPFGDTLIGTGQFFPQSEIGGIGQGGYLGAGKFLGPVPKLVLGSTTGINPSTGKPFSRPFDPANPDPAAPALWKQAVNLFPQTKLIEGALGKDQVARYSTGDVVNPKAPIPTGRTWVDAAASYLGVPIYDKSVAEQSQADKVNRALGGASTKKKASGGKTAWAKAHR